MLTEADRETHSFSYKLAAHLPKWVVRIATAYISHRCLRVKDAVRIRIEEVLEAPINFFFPADRQDWRVRVLSLRTRACERLFP